MLRAGIYARISREDVGNVDNTDIQVAECVEYIKRQGWQYVATPFVDDNISAYSENAHRPQYEALLNSIRTNKLDIVVCTEMSRLNRRLWESISLFQLAGTTDFKRIATTDGGGFDLSTPEGRDNAIRAAMEAEKESRRLAERQRRKKRQQAMEGKYNGGPKAFGFEGPIRAECRVPGCTDENCKHGMILNRGRIGVELVESEAAIIAEIVQRSYDGESDRSIAADLKRRGIKTATGLDFDPSTVGHLLASPKICGMRTHHGELRPAVWEAIVPYKKWEELQLRRQAHANGQTKVQARRYLLTGIAVCGNCDAPMLGRNWHRDGAIIPKYICSKDELYARRAGCGKVYRASEPLDVLVSEAVVKALTSPRLLVALSTQSNDSELRGLVDEEIADKAKLKELKAAWANRVKGLTLQDMLDMKAMIEDNMEARRRKIATMQSGRALGRIPLGADMRTVWETADLDFKRDLIRLVVEKVVVLPGRTYQLWRGKYRFDPRLIRIHWKV